MSGLTIDNPIGLTVAFSSQNIIPGDTLLLRGGTYTGEFICSVGGVSGTYVTVKPYKNERVIIDGQLQLTGDYVKILGLEITNNTNRNRSTMVGTNGIKALGNYNIIANCVIHDQDQGLTTSDIKTGHIYYGNLFYFNGWDSSLGHGMYPQNNVGNIKTIKRNIIFNNFGYGIHAWGSSGDVSNFVVDGNTCFQNGSPRNLLQRDILNGNQTSFTSPIIHNNMTYKISGSVGDDRSAQVGYGTGNQALDVSVYDNYFVSFGDALSFVDATITRFDGNTIIGTLSGVALGSNTQLLSYPESGTQIFLTNNEYDADRAQLTIYNWSLADAVSVDVTAIYSNGDTIQAHNVQDYFTDIQTLTVTAGAITVNMQRVNRTVATPVGWTAPATTYPQFGCFVLERV